MSRLLVFQHVAAEPLGTLDALIRQRGHRTRFVNFERDPDAQPGLDRYRGLIVLGGPMNVEDHDHRHHLLTEMRCIEQALRRGLPVLGICLGAQLLAHVLGAPIRRHVQQEIGWYDWHPTDAGRSDPVLGQLPAGSAVFQWHGYTFEVPRDATHLGRTPTCENQAFRWGESAYGLQFHLEMDRPLIERWLTKPEYRKELECAGLGHGASEILAATESRIGPMQQAANAVFGRFLDQVGRPAKRIVLASRD